jgi:hypothetical protein
MSNDPEKKPVGRLAFLIGLPKSGKSPLAREWAGGRGEFKSLRRMSEKSTRPRVVVCAARIRRALGHQWNSYAEGFVDATKHTMIRALLYDYDVLVDGTHTTRPSIQRMFEIDPEAEFMFLDTPPTLCKDNALREGRADLVPVIDRMAAQMLNLAGVDHWDDIEARMEGAVNSIRLLAWEQVIAD